MVFRRELIHGEVTRRGSNAPTDIVDDVVERRGPPEMVLDQETILYLSSPGRPNAG